jgi:hypothetical protein
MNAGDIDFYAITVPPRAGIRIELIEGDRAVEQCETNTMASQLTLFNHSLTPVAEDTPSRGYCSLIDGTGTGLFAPHPAARNDTTAPQTFYVMVDQQSGVTGNSAAFIYRLQVSFR